MPKFTIKDLLIATTMVALGLTLAILAFNPRWAHAPKESAQALIPLLILLPGAALATAGVYYPFHKNFAWAIFIGMLITVAGFTALFFLLFTLGIN